MTPIATYPLLSGIAAFVARAGTLSGKLGRAKTMFARTTYDAPDDKSGKTGHVTLLGAGPGAADLLTLRGLAALQAADVIYFDRLVDPGVLTHAKPGTACISVGKAPGHHSVSQDQINHLLVQSAQSGLAVVRLKCGDPGIFGRGAEEADALSAAGISWNIIPGVTAACAAAAAANSFLTERGQTERVIFATGQMRHGCASDWAACAAPGTTLACYMGVSSAAALQGGLVAAGWPISCLVEVISKAQTTEQLVLRGRLGDLAQLCQSQPALNPAILLIRWPSDAQTPAHGNSEIKASVAC